MVYTNWCMAADALPKSTFDVGLSPIPRPVKSPLVTIEIASTRSEKISGVKARLSNILGSWRNAGS